MYLIFGYRKLNFLPNCWDKTPHLVHDVLELHDGHADEPVLSPEAVVLDPDVQLVGRDLVLVPDNAETEKEYHGHSYVA